MDLTMRLALVIDSPLLDNLDNLPQEVSSAPFSQTSLRFLILRCQHPTLPESSECMSFITTFKVSTFC